MLDEEFIRKQGGWCVGHLQAPTVEIPQTADRKGSKCGSLVSPAIVKEELAAGTCLQTWPVPWP